MTGTIGSHGLFRLRSFLGTIVESEKDNSSPETCHDREAREMAGQRVVRKTKVPMATADRG